MLERYSLTPRNMSDSPVNRAMRFRVLAISLSVALLLTACENTGNPRPAPGLQNAGALTLEPVAVFGTGRNRTEFGNITDIFVTANTMLVADGISRSVLRFNLASGDLIQSVGRAGVGPGEFRYPIAVSGDDDTAYVFDELASRVTSFGPDGQVQDSWEIERQPQFGQKSEAELTAEGQLFAVGYSRFQDGLLRNLGSRARGITRGDNTILMWQRGPSQWIEIVHLAAIEVFADVGRGQLVDVAYPRKPLWKPALTGEGVWAGDSGDTLVVFYPVVGPDTLVLSTSFAPYPIHDSVKAAYLNAEDLNDRDPNSVRQARERRASLPFPEVMPALISILPDSAGRVWLVGRTPDEGLRLRRVEPSGVIEDYHVPEPFEPFAVRGRMVYGVLTDSLGVETPAVYRAAVSGS